MSAVTFTTSSALRKSTLRHANERLVLNLIRSNPGVSRLDIARTTRLSPSSVTYVVSRLKKKALLVEKASANHSQVGRKPTGLYLRSDARVVVGVEIALAESRVAAADLNGQILSCESIPWHPNPRLFLSRIHHAIRSVVRTRGHANILGVGVAVPGSVDSTTGIVQAAENLGWSNVAAGEILSNGLDLRFYCENNAKLSALAERWFCPERNVGSHFVFVCLHTGLGTGVIINGHLLHAGSAAAAEFGHVSLHLDGGRPCPCGNVGCWEQYAADFALIRLYHQYAGSRTNGHEVTSAEQVVRMARDSDPAAVRAVRETAAELGAGLVNLIWALNPDTIVLGDYAAEGWDLVRGPLMNAVQSRVAPYLLARLGIFPSANGANAALMGSIAVVLDRFFHRFDHEESTPAWGAQSAILSA
jgi:predicted NBD/HSP70 family sugar kinase